MSSIPNKAILQVADTGPLESLAHMLASIGIQCYVPNNKLLTTLRSIGCDTVLSIDQLVNGMGYDKPDPLPTATVSDLRSGNFLYFGIKAHRNKKLILGS